MRYLLAPLILLPFLSVAHAQKPVSIGLEAGVTSSTIDLRFGDLAGAGPQDADITFDPLRSFHLGVPIEIGLGKRFGIQTGVHYLRQGFTFPFSDETGTLSGDASDLHHTLEAPALARYRCAAGGWSFARLLGPSFQYRVAQSFRVGGESLSPANEPPPWRAYAACAQAALRVAYALPVGEVGLTGRYRYQLNDLNPSPIAASRLRAYSLAAGYMLPLN